MARRGLERADVALLVVDSEQGVTQGDAQIASYAEESGRSVVIVMNKWDLAAEAARQAAARDAATTKGRARRGADEKHNFDDLDKGKLLFDYEKMVRGKLKFLSYAPIIFLSAKTGERTQAPHLHAGLESVAQGRRRSAARQHAEGASRAHLLHHPSQSVAAHVSFVHQPKDASALQLRALPGKPTARQVRLRRNARALCAAPPETRRAKQARKA